MQWSQKPNWDGADAYIIGGGPSLRGFDFGLLRGRHTIGINDAFRVSPEICFFSDEAWLARNESELTSFPGWIVTHCEHQTGVGRVLTLPRREEGLHTEALGFGGHSAPGAVNLALVLGASRVFLLGCDCSRDRLDGATHWHDHNQEEAKAGLYEKFVEGWQAVHRDLYRVFPGRRIIKLVGPLGSDLHLFPSRNLATHFVGQEAAA